MRKFLAVVKHEYRKIVLKWTFLLGTLLFPLLGAGFAVVPAIIFSLKGEPTRVVIVDASNKIAPRLKGNLSAERITEKARKAAKDSLGDLNATQEEKMKSGANQLAAGFVFIDFDNNNKSPEQIRQELNAKAAADEIDAYLLIPANIEKTDAKYEFRSRKAGDFVANDTLKDALNEAVRSERLAAANIDEKMLQALSQNVDFESKSINEKGEEKDGDVLFIASLIIGMMIYISLTIYGQIIMGAVVEEKETRIAEILFSSARPFELMLGKLVGVGLAGLTQLGIWVGSLVALGVFLSTQADMSPILGSLPRITPVMVGYFFAYFIVGYFTYAAIFALIGSMVTTVQEGGQFAFPPIMIMLIGFYFGFAVIRDPNSSLSFWVSIAPFFAPLTMPIRILAETPPLWQIGLSLFINCLTIAGLVWLAARVYRVGMLMYGKRATIPEVWKWIRQA
ncbi:MAG TPA: ABC transporter permease [Pyrinomonadaceae bacterium]|nr:ABC transporter permease [Acidobacteriota bacterium]HQZ97089.1 ABC transporter permease [Pyrinomonadaceae bacterium]